MRQFKYWVGQKARSCFFVRCYGKTLTNFLANPMYFIVKGKWINTKIRSLNKI